ncbi:MAG: LysE family translocator [Actinobacteria bacterium]|nr:LysE family translocator [Actinomycetota bacterium]
MSARQYEIYRYLYIMSEIIQIFFGSLVVAFTGAMMPGPMLTLVITSVAQKGFWTAVFIVTGHSILELLIVISFYLGILKYLDNPLVIKIISILGGVFLLYMAVSIIISILRKKIKLDLENKKANRSLGTKSTFIIAGKGVLISLANPYWYIWWLTIGATFMIRSVNFNIGGVSAFYIGHILADFIWYLLIGFIISTGRRFFNQKIYTGILILCSLFLMYLGVKFIVDFLVK